MKNTIPIFLLFTILACNSTAEHKKVKAVAVKADISVTKTIKVKTVLVPVEKPSKKIFNQCDPNCVWKYYHPFADTSYVLRIQNCPAEHIGEGKNAVINFVKDNGNSDKVFLQDSLLIQIQNEFLEYKDFNGDGVKDVVIFSQTGARGGNSFYYLYLVDVKNKKIVRVKDFENIVNPEYNKKYNVVVAYGLAGSNYYSIYKISKSNKAHKIDEAFEDNFNSDDDILDRKISQILKKNK